MVNNTGVRCALCRSRHTGVRLRLKEPLNGTAYEVAHCRSCGYVYNQSLADGSIDHRALFGEAFYTLHHDACFKLASSKGTYRQDAKFGLYRRVLNDLERRGSSGSILEVGCGMGSFLDYARDRGWQPRGIEISDYAARHASEAFGLDIFCGEIQDAMIEAGSVDVVAAFDVIEHVLNPLTFLVEARNSLRPGGYLVLVTDDDSGFIPRVSRFLYAASRGIVRYPCSRAYPIFNASYFSGALLEGILSRMGFETVLLDGIDQAISRTRVSGYLERLALHAMYAAGEALSARYQVLMVCQLASDCREALV
jgi:2-polyprenyl-3-methyl-5-hydroxy-6-metoxy-1,4-benzoquinol methylase